MGEGNVDESIVPEDRLPGRILEQVSTCLIKPSTATPSEKEWLPLCTLDILFSAFYTPILCTFKLTGEQSQAAVQHLKDSLGDALVLFYPLAGRVVKTGGPPRIHCNDAGAVFTEASVDADLAELRTDDFQPQPLLSGLAAAGLGDYPTLPQLDTGLPALVIQVTHFKCGGITLVVNWAHAVADGQAGFHFLKSWSELARGLEVSLLPDHRRQELLKPRKSAHLVTANPLLSTAILSPGAQIIKNSNLTSAAAEAVSTEKKVTVIPKTIAFTEDDIAKLKQQALEQQQQNGQQLSRADCLSTHLLRSIARARNLQPDSTSTVRLLLLVEGRKKLSLPPGYFGNVISMLSVIATVRELNHSFGDVANLVHSAVSSVTGDWFQDLVDFVSQVVAGKLAAPSLDDPAFPRMTSVGISYLHRFCFYELDFGFGVPAHSTRNTMAARDGLFFVLPTSHGKDHLTVLANIDSDVMPSFLSMAHDIHV